MDLYYENYLIEDLPGEEWKDIYGYDGIYSVSNLGRIKSERRPNPNGRQWLNERIMKQHVSKSNPHNLKEMSKSLMVTLTDNGVNKGHHVSVIVGNAFIGECGKKQVFSKVDKIWNNCKADNLKIETVSDCTKLAYKKGNNLRNKKTLKIGHRIRFEYKRLSDGKIFTNPELVKEYTDGAKSNINKAIDKNKMAYNSLWIKIQIAQ